MLDHFLTDLDGEINEMVTDLITRKWLEYKSNPFFPSIDQDEKIVKVWSLTKEDQDRMERLLEYTDYKDEEKWFWETYWDHKDRGFEFEPKNTHFYQLNYVWDRFWNNETFDLEKYMKNILKDWKK